MMISSPFLAGMSCGEGRKETSKNKTSATKIR